MLWKLKHRLFGWHYVRIEFGWSYKTARVLTDGDGEPYVYIYGSHIPLRASRFYNWFPLTFRRVDLLGDPEPQGRSDAGRRRMTHSNRGLE